MTLKIFYEDSVDQSLIKNKKVAVFGYGNQGRGQALNLKDSGVNVVIALRDSSHSREKAKNDHIKVLGIVEAVQWADLIVVLIPDESQKTFYEHFLQPHLRNGQTILFSHGFNIHYKAIVVPKDVDVIMVAPKGPGHLVRKEYVQGGGVPCLIAVHQQKNQDSFALALSYASAIGGTRAGAFKTTFKEEVESDLFGEQTVLCGGISSLILMGFETLVEAGYSPEIAYFECLHESKLIVDLIFRGGLEHMRKSISNTAEYGDLTRGSRVIDSNVKDKMRSILKDIQSGSFAKEWLDENHIHKMKTFNALRQKAKTSLLEKVGKELRSKIKFSSNS